MRWRIRYQLLVPLLLLLLGVVGASVWTAEASARRARQRVERRVRDMATTLEKSPPPLHAPRVLQQIKQYSGADYALVLRSGETLSTFDPDQKVTPPPGAVYDRADALTLGPRVVVGGKSYLCSGLRLHSRDPERPETGETVYIFYPEAELHEAVWEARWPVLLLGGLAALASVALAVWLGQSLSRRLHELERRTRLIAAGDFRPMPLPRFDDEIRDLTRSVNEMAQKLAQFQETMKRSERLRLLGQVSGGLAHQLRNGVTGAKLAVQLYAREAAGRTDTAALDVALRQLTLLETHLKRFLDLGRQDPAPRREPCALAALVGEAVELLRPRCRHAGIDLRWHPPAEPCVVEGDAGQLGQLFVNVLGNAVEAAGPGGWVQCKVQSAKCKVPNGDGGGSVVVEVEDSGPGPAADVAERLFEPFVTGKAEGVGLGLAVARQTAEAHGGRITWKRLADRTCFRIELPARAADVAERNIKAN